MLALAPLVASSTLSAFPDSRYDLATLHFYRRALDRKGRLRVCHRLDGECPTITSCHANRSFLLRLIQDRSEVLTRF